MSRRLIYLIVLFIAAIILWQVVATKQSTPIQPIQASSISAAELGTRANTPVVSNKSWMPIETDFAGIPMVLVPKGCFTMGSSDSEIRKLNSEYDGLTVRFGAQGPQTQLCFESAFWIDKYPVTNKQFEQFKGKADKESYWKGDNRPRETITWFEAKDFCSLRDARLPTEAEWEYAARGPDALVYPWGNEWNPDNAVWSLYVGDEYPKDISRQTSDVGSKLQGASWVGALDLSGNVWEWTSSLYTAYPYNKNDGREAMESEESRTLRGGSWSYLDFYHRTDYRLNAYPLGAENQIGFRCIRSFSR